MHLWRIGDRATSYWTGPCQVASPQSLTLLLPAPQPYRRRPLIATTVGHRSYALENPFWACDPPLRAHFPDEPFIFLSRVFFAVNKTHGIEPAAETSF